MFRSGTQEQRKERNTHKQLSKLPVYKETKETKETKIHTLQNSIISILKLPRQCTDVFNDN